MYLRGAVVAPKDSPLAKVIDENMTQEYLDAMSEGTEEDPSYAYVSGWTFGSREPEPMYVAICNEVGFTSTEDSPSIHLCRDGKGGYIAEMNIYYWRKANAIHKWFVDNCQGGIDECQPSLVHPELLIDLIERCEAVTESHDRASTLLPTQGGFFFGPTEYEEWYFEDVERTAENLRPVIEQVGPRCSHFIYESSW